MKVCILGNSYIVALKNAIDAKQPVGIEFSYIFAPGSHIEEVDFSSTTVSAVGRAAIFDSEGQSPPEVDLATFDAFVVSGLGLHSGTLGQFTQGVRLAGDADSKARLVSRALVVEYGVDDVRAGRAYRIATELRKVTDKPIYLLAQPTPSERLRTIPLADMNPYQAKSAGHWEPFFDTANGRRAAEIFSEALVLAASRSGMIGMPQLPRTQSGGLTLKKYQMKTRSEMSPGPNGPRPHPDEDLLHANAKYGAIALTQLLTELRKLA